MQSRVVAVRRNIIANFAGRSFYAAISLGVLPIYIRLLGIEQYGLVGFYATLQTVLAIFDFGLTAATTREVAASTRTSGVLSETRSIVHTLEAVYWPLAAFIVVLVSALAGPLAANWVTSATLSPPMMKQCISLMGLAIALQWPINLYTGSLRGLQRQVAVNISNSTAVGFRVGLTLLILINVSRTPLAFFICQVIASFAHALGVRIYLRHVFANAVRANSSVAVLHRLWRLATQASASTAVNVVIGQLDKIVVSITCPLTVFARYSLAASAAGALSFPMMPISDAVIPRLAQIASDDVQDCARLFHRAAQLGALTVLPAAVTLTFFSTDVLHLWTRNPQIARESGNYLAILALAAGINQIVMGSMDLLQVGLGWMAPAVYTRAAVLLMTGPFFLPISRAYGPMGAASLWLIGVVAYAVITPNFVFARLLTSEKWRWYLFDFITPVVVAVVCTFLLHKALPAPTNIVATASNVVSSWVVTTAAVLVSMPHTRAFITTCRGYMTHFAVARTIEDV